MNDKFMGLVGFFQTQAYVTENIHMFSKNLSKFRRVQTYIYFLVIFLNYCKLIISL